jgi:hypothetical protein
MDKIIDSQFLRVEKALSTLINSIATYNPSPQLATDLVTADHELSKGLELCMYFPDDYRDIICFAVASLSLISHDGSLNLSECMLT